MGESASVQVGNEDRTSNPRDDSHQQNIDQNTGEQTGQQEEQLIAGKYKTQEDLEKGTLELLKKQGGDLEQIYKTLESGKNPFETSTKEEEETKEPDGMKIQTDNTGEESREETKKNLEKNDLNIEEFEQEFLENGELSQESYDKLTEVFPKQMVDNYIEGQKLQAQQYQNEIFDVAGGQENYAAMVDWASKNLSNEEIKEFNDAVSSGSKARAKLAVQAVQQAYQTSSPGGNLLEGDRGGSSGSPGYQSKEEMLADMKDPKYSKDPAFRARVQEKVRNSSVI